jgi:hypothetical protein
MLLKTAIVSTIAGVDFRFLEALREKREYRDLRLKFQMHHSEPFGLRML